MSKTACLFLMLIALSCSQIIRVPTIATSNLTISPTLINVLARTQTAYTYHGTVDIQIT
jgi:hypothetical protein